MADNITTNPGDGGAVLATDDIGGIHYARSKNGFGVDGAYVDVSATNPMPVNTIDATASGTIAAAAQNVALALNGKSGVAVQITGTWVGTLQFEGTVDGTNWVAVNGVFAGSSTPGPTTTTNGIVRVTPSGLAQFRITATAWTSGTATITIRASNATGGTFLNQSLTAGTNTIGGVTQVLGTAATRWFAQISDGTNSPAVKAALTAATFTDPALTADVRPGGALVTATATLGDAFANPSLGKQAALNYFYNGATWDLQRGMSGNLTTGDSGAKVATGNGATIANVGNKGVAVVINVGAVTGTAPTAVFKIQRSVDGGTNWVDIPGATTASLVASGLYGITVYPGIAVTAGMAVSGTEATANGVMSRAWRLVWTIGGTTPSFTITSVSYNYLPN